MKWFLRRILDVLAALSLVCGIMAVPAWVRSYTTLDEISWQSATTIASVQSSQGQIGYYGATIHPGQFDNAAGRGLRCRTWPAQPLEDTFVNLRDPESWHAGGFVVTFFRKGANRFHNLLLPYWFVLMLTFILPLHVTARLRRR